MARCRMLPLLLLVTTTAILLATHASQGKEHSPKDVKPHPDDNKNGGDQHVKGHLKPFGESGSRSPLTEIMGFPARFFKDYFLTFTPVLLKGAAKLSPAFKKWTDRNLRRIGSVASNAKEVLQVETRKKESRSQDIKEMTLVEFLDVYNTTDLYVVDDVPEFLQPDLLMPCVLQCPDLEIIPLAKTMWFSSGGTKSVVHTDSYDNINCLFRGTKTITLIDPTTISTGSLIDRPSGTFSALDVDRVDLDRYPTLRGARFYEVNMEPGDCLYIPYLWIHQVRSYDSNLAVNFWWDRFHALDVLHSNHCMNDDAKCDLTSTVDLWLNPHLAENDVPEEFGLNATKDLMTSLFEYAFYHVDRPSDFDPNSPAEERVKITVFMEVIEFSYLTYLEEKPADVVRSVREKLKVICDSMDTDGDNVVSKKELEGGRDHAWELVFKLMFISNEVDKNGEENSDEKETASSEVSPSDDTEEEETMTTADDESGNGEKSFDKEEL